jgi:ATP-dependent helicase/nuclease subunit B
MNRAMRTAVGLTSPERRIGLAAHDFQQAASQPQVILSRSLKSEGAETVPARWLSRLVNLLKGLPEGRPALEGMKYRGGRLVSMALALDQSAPRVAGASRPAPRPPVAARPTSLSVTEVETLVRNPYAIYAKHVLGLRKLDPLRPEPDAPLQGSILHTVLQRFVEETIEDPTRLDVSRLVEIAERELARAVPWPGIRRVWLARSEGFAPWFVAEELGRRGMARPVTIEEKGLMVIDDPPFRLIGKPDRIDLLSDGTAEIIDYKSGRLPQKQTLERFDKQLLLLALMAESGAFQAAKGAVVSRVTHYGLGETKLRATAIEPGQLVQVGRELSVLLGEYLRSGKGYAARRLPRSERLEDYDQLARLGEWSMADWPEPEDVT